MELTHQVKEELIKRSEKQKNSVWQNSKEIRTLWAKRYSVDTNKKWKQILDKGLIVGKGINYRNFKVKVVNGEHY